MSLVIIDSPSGYKLREHKFNPLNPMLITIGKFNYECVGCTVDIEELLNKVTPTTKNNLQYLIDSGVQFNYAKPIIVARFDEYSYAWSIPVFGEYKKHSIIFWRKETKSSQAGQTLLYIDDKPLQFSKVKYKGLDAFIKENIGAAPKEFKPNKTQQSIDELIDV